MRARPLSTAGSLPSAFDGKQRRASDTPALIKPSQEPRRNHGHHPSHQRDPHRPATGPSSEQHLSPPPMDHSGQLQSPIRRTSIATGEHESKGDKDEAKEPPRRGGRESRSSSSSRTSLGTARRDPSKNPIPIDERPRWVGTWSSLTSRSSLASLKTAASDKSVQRRQSSPNISLSPSSSSRSSSPCSRAASLSPLTRIANGAITSPCNNPSGRSNSISHKATTPTIGSPLGPRSQNGNLQGKQQRIFDSMQGGHGVEDFPTVHLHDQQQQCQPGGTSLMPPTDNSPELIRRLLGSTNVESDPETLDSTVGSSSIGAIDDSGINSGDMIARRTKGPASVHSTRSLSLVSLVAPTTVIAPFVATALFGQQLHMLDDSDAHSYRSYRSYCSHSSNDLPVNDGESSTNGERETDGNPSPAQEAMSRLVKQNDHRQRSLSNLVSALTSKARLLHIPSGNSLTESGGGAREEGSSKTAASVTPSPSSSKSSSRSSMSLESQQVKEHHVHVSGIESFPKHRPSSRSSLAPKVQYIRNLLRLPNSALTATVADGMESKSARSL